MTARKYALLLLALTGAAAVAGCNDLADSLLDRPGSGGSGDEDPAVAALGQKVVAGHPMVRNLSNREYIAAVSDLIGEKLPLDLTKSWTATTQFSGFDAVPWTNLDTKAVRDRGETLELILDKAVASKKVMTCDAKSDAELAYESCAKTIVEPIANRAYGRDLSPEETKLLATRYADGVTLAKTALTDPHEIFVDGLRAALGSVLLAPQFVTRIEAPPSPDFVGERDLGPYELASRVSFMFTSSLPDEELWSKAKDGSLKDPEVLQAQVKRLIDDKTDDFVEIFMGQWFDFRAFETAAEGSIEAAMHEESRRTLAAVIKDDLPISAIVKPGFTYLNKDLAKHYNIPGDFPDALTRVPTDERGGILQQGSWLTSSASALKTSPIHRGRLVQDRLLCKVIPPPDSALFEQIQKVSASIPANATVKERLEQHRNAGQACFGCHQYMDPLGLGLEGFDQHGRLRKAYSETGHPVEIASNLLGKPFETFNQLNQMVAELPDYQKCAAEKLAVYSVRRIVDVKTADDAALVDYLAHPVDGKAPSVREMILRLVKSNAFRKVKH